uniref:Uncharacterized protein n=1 Tax=Knipowitschia caucasica TaxID=637954 RepID=A0AAV2MMM2_KNICA
MISTGYGNRTSRTSETPQEVRDPRRSETRGRTSETRPRTSETGPGGLRPPRRSETRGRTSETRTQTSETDLGGSLCGIPLAGLKAESLSPGHTLLGGLTYEALAENLAKKYNFSFPHTFNRAHHLGPDTPQKLHLPESFEHANPSAAIRQQPRRGMNGKGEDHLC